jgi:hypothetical protein
MDLLVMATSWGPEQPSPDCTTPWQSGLHQDWGTHHHLANPMGPCVTSSGTSTPAVKAATAARLIFTLPCSEVRYLLTSKCQMSQWPMLASHQKGPMAARISNCATGPPLSNWGGVKGCHAVSIFSLLVWAWWVLCWKDKRKEVRGRPRGDGLTTPGASRQPSRHDSPQEGLESTGLR